MQAVLNIQSLATVCFFFISSDCETLWIVVILKFQLCFFERTLYNILCFLRYIDLHNTDHRVINRELDNKPDRHPTTFMPAFLLVNRNPFF